MSDDSPAWDTFLSRVTTLIDNDSLAGIANQAVSGFERTIARMGSVKHAISTPSGTQALEIALEAAGVGEGDEVIVPAFSAFGTVAAVVRRGATPVVIDVDPHRMTMAPQWVGAALTDKTKAIIPIHAMGVRPDIPGIRAAAAGTFILEDLAQGFPGRVEGDAAALSFTRGKLIDIGEGGAVLTNDTDFGQAARWITCLGHAGVDVDGMEIDLDQTHSVIGTSARMPALQAALGLYRAESLVKRLEGMLDRAARLREAATESTLQRMAEPDVPLAVCFYGTVTDDWADRCPLLRPAQLYRAHRQPAVASRCRVLGEAVAESLEAELVVISTDEAPEGAISATCLALGE